MSKLYTLFADITRLTGESECLYSYLIIPEFRQIKWLNVMSFILNKNYYFDNYQILF